MFFDELRPLPARPGQFEEAHWPEDAGGGADGGDGVSIFAGGACGFEEVTLPELEEEEEGHKILPMSSRRQRRKLGAHRSYKVRVGQLSNQWFYFAKTVVEMQPVCFQDCDWSDKDWPCLCGDAKSRRLRRKGCPHCHGSKVGHSDQFQATAATHSPHTSSADTRGRVQGHQESTPSLLTARPRPRRSS